MKNCKGCKNLKLHGYLKAPNTTSHGNPIYICKKRDPPRDIFMTKIEIEAPRKCDFYE